MGSGVTWYRRIRMTLSILLQKFGSEIPVSARGHRTSVIIVNSLHAHYWYQMICTCKNIEASNNTENAFSPPGPIEGYHLLCTTPLTDLEDSLIRFTAIQALRAFAPSLPFAMVFPTPQGRTHPLDVVIGKGSKDCSAADRSCGESCPHKLHGTSSLYAPRTARMGLEFGLECSAACPSAARQAAES